MKTLADLNKGYSAEIEWIDTSGPGVLRLMMLGLVEGAAVRHRGTAIGGDPLELSVYGASISVRREQARYFKVNGNAAEASSGLIP
ncbi:MAG: ferrous iron transport protein A [Xanthomonadales bacterium]|nr:ferrous iron transport protein A [Xanthomonadales bacterium]NNL95017.1 ferrous iron transport protein A [Xanthomonadales bacterium]